jgi:hypothetical protein
LRHCGAAFLLFLKKWRPWKFSTYNWWFLTYVVNNWSKLLRSPWRDLRNRGDLSNEKILYAWQFSYHPSGNKITNKCREADVSEMCRPGLEIGHTPCREDSHVTGATQLHYNATSHFLRVSDASTVTLSIPILASLDNQIKTWIGFPLGLPPLPPQ